MFRVSLLKEICCLAWLRFQGLLLTFAETRLRVKVISADASGTRVPFYVEKDVELLPEAFAASFVPFF